VSKNEIERAISDAKASVEMEGLTVKEETVDYCRRIASGELTLEDYLRDALSRLAAEPA